MKCPKCNQELVTQKRYGIDVDYCPNDHGMWLDFVELGQLENEVFKAGEHDKGSLMLSSSPTNLHVPNAAGSCASSSTDFMT